MGESLYIDIDGMKDSIQRLQRAIESFEPYSKNFLKETEKSLDPMNSDFVDTIQDAINNMRNTKAPKLVKKLNSYVKAAGKVVEELENMDREVGEMITESTKGINE